MERYRWFWDASFDRLDAHLRRAAPGRDEPCSQHIEITRIFDAPRELVYRAFSTPASCAQWFGPVGCSVPRDSIEIDARVGGHLRFVMIAPDVRSPVDATFTEVVENELLAGEMEAPACPAWPGLCACS